jgi:hypothetical protein
MADKPVELVAKDGKTDMTHGRIRAFRPELLDAYKRMLAYQFSGALVLIGVLTVALFISYVFAKQWQPPVLMLVTLAGMLGAFFSALVRLHTADQLSIAIVSDTATHLRGWHLFMYSLTPPIIGAIASVVLYIAFLAGLVSGGLFPAMSCKDANGCKALGDVLNSFGPTEAQDYGKALIWAFIAGFSERLVPDTLQSLVAKTEKDRAG